VTKLVKWFEQEPSSNLLKISHTILGRLPAPSINVFQAFSDRYPAVWREGGKPFVTMVVTVSGFETISCCSAKMDICDIGRQTTILSLQPIRRTWPDFRSKPVTTCDESAPNYPGPPSLGRTTQRCHTRNG
jgi:hypothetical protein